MAVDRVEELHALLNAEGRELVNIKFIPGTSRELTVEQLAEEARASISRAFACELVDKPPRAVRSVTYK